MKYLTKKLLKKQVNKKHFRVAIFGSARINRKSKKYKSIYDSVYKLSKMIGAENIDIVTGGGPGLMEAAARGHKEGSKGKAETWGLIIQMPKKQRMNHSISVKKDFKRFSKRLDKFASLSNVFVVAPGGIGTTLELFYVWQLVQVRKICNEVPIILMGEMWSKLIKWMMKWQLRRNLIDKKDLNGIFFVHNPAEAMEIIKKAYELYKKGNKNICPNIKKYKISI
jgi:hypothetical protein